MPVLQKQRSAHQKQPDDDGRDYCIYCVIASLLSALLGWISDHRAADILPVVPDETKLKTIFFSPNLYELRQSALSKADRRQAERLQLAADRDRRTFANLTVFY